jgi:hypothetical protein
MVVDSTFNFEKKRLTPTRRLVLGAATETARDEWKLSADNYMFFLLWEHPDTSRKIPLRFSSMFDVL